MSVFTIQGKIVSLEFLFCNFICFVCYMTFLYPYSLCLLLFIILVCYLKHMRAYACFHFNKMSTHEPIS